VSTIVNNEKSLELADPARVYMTRVKPGSRLITRLNAGEVVQDAAGAWVGSPDVPVRVAMQAPADGRVLSSRPLDRASVMSGVGVDFRESAGAGPVFSAAAALNSVGSMLFVDCAFPLDGWTRFVVALNCPSGFPVSPEFAVEVANNGLQFALNDLSEGSGEAPPSFIGIGYVNGIAGQSWATAQVPIVDTWPRWRGVVSFQLRVNMETVGWDAARLVTAYAWPERDA
jgi:hypothetical protein